MEDKIIILLAVRLASWYRYTWYQKIQWWFKYKKALREES